MLKRDLEVMYLEWVGRVTTPPTLGFGSDPSDNDAQLTTEWITLGATWEPLTSWWVIGALVVLGRAEFFADKIPAVNRADDLVQTFVRPAAF